jgi:hypothetical protein
LAENRNGMSASDGCGENPVAVFGALLYSGSSQFLPFQSVGIVDFLNVGTLNIAAQAAVCGVLLSDGRTDYLIQKG